MTPVQVMLDALCEAVEWSSIVTQTKLYMAGLPA
jgi:hypothetical protein